MKQFDSIILEREGRYYNLYIDGVKLGYGTLAEHLHSLKHDRKSLGETLKWKKDRIAELLNK